METVPVEVKEEEVKDLKQKMDVLIHDNQAIIVQDEAQCKAAGEYTAQLQMLKKRIQDYFSPIKSQAHKLHRELCKREQDELKPIEQEVNRVKGLIKGFYAEVQRQEAERRRKEEDERRKKEELARKEAALLKDKEAKAEKEMEAATLAFNPVQEEVKPDIKLDTGRMTTAKRYRFNVTDRDMVLRGLLSGAIPQDAVSFTLNTRNLTSYCKANNIESLPGIQVVVEDDIRIGG